MNLFEICIIVFWGWLIIDSFLDFIKLRRIERKLDELENKAKGYYKKVI